MLTRGRVHLLGNSVADAPKKKRAMVYQETEDQKLIVQWLRDRPDWMVMRMENAARRTPAQSSRDKAMGMLTGATDLVLLYKREVVFFEVKKSGGKVREDQEQCHRELLARGQHVMVGYGVEDSLMKLEAFERTR